MYIVTYMTLRTNKDNILDLFKGRFNITKDVDEAYSIETDDFCHHNYDELINLLVSTIGDNFTVDGTVDGSYCSGEYENFRIEYQDSHVRFLASKWYQLFNPDDYSDYDEFTDEFEDKYSKKDYKRFLKTEKELYIISNDKDITDTITLAECAY